MSKVLISYVPVIHRGYMDLFARHADADRAYVLGEEVLSEFKELRKDIRSLTPLQAVGGLVALQAHLRIALADLRTIAALRVERPTVVVPNDEVCQLVQAHYLGSCDVVRDTHFLRWDSKTATSENEIRPDEEVTEEELHCELMQLAEEEAGKSSDWWRHVGGVVAQGSKVLFVAHNQHQPTELAPYMDGDPRSSFKKGLHVELSLPAHAEAVIVAMAARYGISLHGASLYVTTFPCPPCARVLAYSGISTLYFRDGYSVLDGAELLRRHAIKIVRVKMKNPHTS